jgi:Tfp pilus assembly protein PilF
MFRPVCLAAALSLAFAPAAPIRAEEPAEKELFKAIELRLEAKNLFQLSQVIGHCQKALDLGLNEGQKAFCQKMLVAALVERASEIAKRKLNEERRKVVLDDLEQAVKIDPTASRAFMLLAKIQAIGGDRKAAVASVTKAIDAEKAQGEKGDVELLIEALQLRADLTEDTKQKQADLEQAIKLSPDSVGLLRERGQTFLADGKFKEAQADFEAALRIDGKNAQVLSLLGLVQMAQDKLDDAVKSFTAAIEAGPPVPAAHLQRGRIYLQQGKAQDALNDINKAISLVEPTGELLLLRASAYHALKNDERAVKDAESALKIADDDAQVMLQAGLIFYQAKRNDKALETFDKLIDKDSKNAAAYAARADTYLQSGEHVKAVDDYTESLKHESDNTHVLNNLAWVLATSPDEKVRDGRRSIDLAKKACELTKYKQAHIVSTLAAGYAEMGDFETAVKWSKKAVELGDKDVVDQLKKELASYEAKKPWREKFGGEEK